MTKKEKALYLLKRYGYLLVLGVCLAIIIVAVVASNSSNKQSAPVISENVNTDKTNNNNNSNINNDNKVNVDTSMYMPVLNATVSKSFSNTSLQYNETLKQFEAHMGVDFLASSGSKVYAVLDGKVSEVGNNYLQGNYIVISHENGLKSVYSSLGDEISVAKGDTVKKGDIIGVVGSSSYSELEEGNHLHFELLDNDKKIDPNNYLNIENK